MYEVHYSDGADHEGVGTFEKWKDARHFANCVRSCGYKVWIDDLEPPCDPVLDVDWDDASDIDQWSRTMGIEARQ